MNSIFHSPLKRRILLVILGIIFWAAIAIPVTLDFIDYGKDKAFRNDHAELISDAENQVQFDFKILSTDLAKRTIKVYVQALCTRTL
ncbi:hypothetical protein CONCODRAFT_12918 [Conidiobolus coronatus NRRL 28638]|uniref:Uncharacterized protein n=1 Tax=Conidiobolus coronatus (strain ATCC 28846 / CBS 209.66 / NRRL 28638) TaxID=796925 RepID=A0A137NRV5_CONC2|nr:hypothetical protein CONCODRAFT_12918 [Conidiobolus coronatus NRRL 28638]|eukprot:KXN65481.1 hypothetical protein CONCODRAFT_12918 [Conidiobolus coronatus NRRL 28638]